MKQKAFFILVLLLLSSVCTGQTGKKITGYPMYFEVTPQGDTVFMETLDPVWIIPKGRKMKSGDWRRYYKLVYNFNKVYPYALVGRKMRASQAWTLFLPWRKTQESKWRLIFHLLPSTPCFQP